jgi:hypothetical protein
MRLVTAVLLMQVKGLLFYTPKDSPQPQVLLAFGFTNTNPFPFKPPS